MIEIIPNKIRQVITQSEVSNRYINVDYFINTTIFSQKM